MIGFWIAASLEGVACAVLILRFAARAQTAMDSGVPAADLAQRNLAEIDALAERGALNETERQGLRAETARRLLSETRQNESAVIRPIPRRVLLAAALAAPIIAVGLYLSVGSPGFGDQPFAKRVTAWRGSDPDKLTAPQMEAVLGQVAREHPNDP
ncbi:MAG: c-type cytochrome biogenesis protein CcmI, partial [Caulobacteraceae bacterium]